MEYREVIREIESGKLGPVYFFFGDEIYLIEDLVRRLVERGTEPSTKDFNYDILMGEETDGKTVVALASSFPMMAEQRVVVLKSVQKLSPSDKKRLSEYVQNPLESTCLILTAEKVDRRQSFYASLVKHSRWVECKSLYENQAVAWVKRYLQERGTALSDEGATFLVQNVGTSLWTLTNEMEKLMTFSWGTKQIGLEEVSAVVGSSRKYNTWNLTDAVGQRDLRAAFTALKRLMEEGQSPVGLIVDMCRRVSLLMCIRAMMDGGVPEAEVTKRLNLRPYFSRLYLDQAQRFSAAELESAIRVLLRADLHIKTGKMTPLLAMTLAVHDVVRTGSGAMFSLSQ
ncbi:MAG: DNA polymerase III subunit delta [bacterium]